MLTKFYRQNRDSIIIPQSYMEGYIKKNPINLEDCSEYSEQALEKTFKAFKSDQRRVARNTFGESSYCSELAFSEFLANPSRFEDVYELMKSISQSRKTFAANGFERLYCAFLNHNKIPFVYQPNVCLDSNGHYFLYEKGMKHGKDFVSKKKLDVIVGASSQEILSQALLKKRYESVAIISQKTKTRERDAQYEAERTFLPNVRFFAAVSHLQGTKNISKIMDHKRLGIEYILPKNMVLRGSSVYEGCSVSSRHSWLETVFSFEEFFTKEVLKYR